MIYSPEKETQEKYLSFEEMKSKLFPNMARKEKKKSRTKTLTRINRNVLKCLDKYLHEIIFCHKNAENNF